MKLHRGALFVETISPIIPELRRRALFVESTTQFKQSSIGAACKLQPCYIPYFS